VLVLDWLLSIILIGGSRFIMRMLSETTGAGSGVGISGQLRKALIVGAGDAGALVVKELQKNPQLNMKAVGFLDDNPAKQKQQISGVPVIGTLNDMSKVLEHQRVDEVIIAIPSAGGKVIRTVADVCRLKGIPFRTMPGIYELIGGKVNINRLREVDITDLLRRQPTHMMEEKVGSTITGKWSWSPVRVDPSGVSCAVKLHAGRLRG